MAIRGSESPAPTASSRPRCFHASAHPRPAEQEVRHRNHLREGERKNLFQDTEAGAPILRAACLQNGAKPHFAARRIPLCQNPYDGSGPAELSSGGERSEEHTSELQSLMRISYAVFCLKKTTT